MGIEPTTAGITIRNPIKGNQGIQTDSMTLKSPNIGYQTTVFVTEE